MVINTKKTADATPMISDFFQMYLIWCEKLLMDLYLLLTSRMFVEEWKLEDRVWKVVSNSCVATVDVTPLEAMPRLRYLFPEEKLGIQYTNCIGGQDGPLDSNRALIPIIRRLLEDTIMVSPNFSSLHYSWSLFGKYTGCRNSVFMARLCLLERLDLHLQPLKGIFFWPYHLEWNGSTGTW